ncbi:MAG: L-cystine transporter [Woeseia sp.]|nr:L-cystine transporter [Woeseia sp.]
MPVFVPINVAVFVGIILLLVRFRQPQHSLSRQVLAGLVAGIAFGFSMQFVYSNSPDIINGTLEWTNVVGTTYVNLLRMIIMPLILVMMISAVVRMRKMMELGKVAFAVISILIGTTMVAAFIAILVTNFFGLTADGLTEGARELARSDVLLSRQESMSALGLTDMLVRFVPSNIFHDLTGARPTSVIAVVIFGILFGIAALLVSAEDEARGESISNFVETVRLIIMKLVYLVMALTPYGILALITKVVAGANAADIRNLITFIIASYLAIALMFGVHSLLLRLNGVRFSDYWRKVWPVLTFAFGSRSSAATIPLTVEAQIEKLDVPQPIANLAATFGATIGQNGCAGIYPAMLATMIAPTMGVDPLSLGFIVGLIGIVAISSFGIAGVGGGATFAALVVLPAMGFPVTIAALLISVEPLIDMARTALNVNGSIVSGVLASKFLRNLPYNAPESEIDS